MKKIIIGLIGIGAIGTTAFLFKRKKTDSMIFEGGIIDKIKDFFSLNSTDTSSSDEQSNTPTNEEGDYTDSQNPLPPPPTPPPASPPPTNTSPPTTPPTLPSGITFSGE